MGTIRVNNKDLKIDSDCFLLNSREWDEDVARAIAREIENIDSINMGQWKIIRFIRQHYEENGTPPTLRRIEKEGGIALAAIHAIFPSGPNSAFRIAGVPKYNGCCL